MAKSELSVRHLLVPLQCRSCELRRAVLESSSLELSRQLARRELGVAFQTRLGIEADIVQGELRFLPPKDNGGIHSDLGLYVYTGRYLSVTVDALARQIAEGVRLREREEAHLNETRAALVLMPDGSSEFVCLLMLFRHWYVRYSVLWSARRSADTAPRPRHETGG